MKRGHKPPASNSSMKYKEPRQGLTGTKSSPSPSGSALRDAAFLPLDARPASPAAKALLDSLMTSAVAYETREGRGNRRGPASQAKLRDALAALFSGLLLNAAHRHQWSRANTRAAAFTGKTIGRRQFNLARAMLRAEGLLEEVESRTEFAGPGVVARRFTTRFRLTPKALRLADKHGLKLATMVKHWSRIAADDDDPPPLRLVEQSTRDGPKRIAGKELKLPRTARRRALEAEVLEFREFLQQQTVTGCERIVLRRQFTEKLDRFDGRWYALGNSYQSMPEAERVQRLRINGEPVAELDVKACGLTVAHGLLRLPLPRGDLYVRVPDWPREVVKRWIVLAIGKGEAPSQWSDDARDKLLAAGISHANYPVRDVGAAVLRRYPFLRALADEVGCAKFPTRTSLRLQNAEANAVTAAMFALKAKGILALPMHDAILAPASSVGVAARALKDAFKTYAGIMPRIDVTRA